MVNGMVGFPVRARAEPRRPVLLGHVYYNDAYDDGADSFATLPIPNLAGTAGTLSVSFVLGTATLVRMRAHILFGKSGRGARCLFYDEDTPLTGLPGVFWGISGQDTQWHPHQGNGGEVNNQQTHMVEVRILGSGAHRINVRRRSDVTNVVIWGERLLRVEAIG